MCHQKRSNVWRTKGEQVKKILITNFSTERSLRLHILLSSRDLMLSMKKRNLKVHMLSSLLTTITDPSGGIRYLSAEGVDANAGRRNEQGDKTTGK